MKNQTNPLFQILRKTRFLNPRITAENFKSDLLGLWPTLISPKKFLWKYLVK